MVRSSRRIDSARTQAACVSSKFKAADPEAPLTLSFLFLELFVPASHFVIIRKLRTWRFPGRSG